MISDYPIGGVLLSAASLLEKKVHLYHTIFTASIIVMLVFLVLSVVLFFVFDIAKVIGIKTGTAKKKSIQEMQEAISTNDSSRLGLKKTKKTVHVKETDNRAENLAGQKPVQELATGEETTLLGSHIEETTLLNSNRGTTEDILRDMNRTELLGPDVQEQINEALAKRIQMTVQKNIMVCHMEDVI